MSRDLASRAARAFDRANVPILKAHVLGAMPDSNARSSVDENERLFVEAGAIVPPYDPEALCLLLENSNSLRQNIDAYVTNIDAFGHRFEPVIDLDADDADQRIANAIYVERLAAKEALRDDPIVQDKPLVPTAAEVAARKKEVAETIRMERSRLDTFFDFCCVDLSFVTLRRRTRQDIETLGNGYWEVLRNASGEIVQFVYVPGFTMRLLRLDPEPVHVDMKVKVSDLAFDAVTVPRRFRRYVQILETQVVYFKEFGDPRILSRKTGELVSSVEELRGRDPSDGPATEILHFKLHNPRSAYGTPRWIGNLLAVLGSRQTEEINFLYFENKSVPPLALLVSGGRLSKSSIPRIEDFIENHIKGKRNFFKVLVLEAEPTQGAPEFAHSGRMRIELKPLTSAQQQDELFSSYDERNIDKVGQAFRLPRLLRGDIRDFNRSCYSADTETLTENGWKRFDEIGDGERIAAYDLTGDAIIYAVPSQKHVHQVDETLLRFHSRATDVLVTADHRMLVRPNGEPGAAWKVMRAEEVHGSRFDLRVAPERFTWTGRTLAEFVLPKDPACRIERGHRHAPVDADAWLEFVGYFVSDGGLRIRRHPAGAYCVYLDQTKPDTLARMRSCLDRLGWTYSIQRPPNGCTRMLLSNRCLRAWLAENCGIDTYSRRLPTEYLHLDDRQLAMLFNALMRGDGHVLAGENARSGSYATSSRVLADQVQQLCVHLGLRAWIRPKKVPSGRPHYSVNITNRSTAPLTAASIERVPYKGHVYCFSVPEHGFFVTRRNGKVAIQGNTADAALHFAEMQVFQPERDEFDFLINRKILSDMGIGFWRFRSNAPLTRDPATMTEMLVALVKAGVLTPEEGRHLAGDIFNRDFKKIAAEWVKQPIALTLAGFAAADDPQSAMVGPTEGETRSPPHRPLPAEAKRLIALRDTLRRESEKRAPAEREVVRVPAADFASWFEGTDVA